MRKASRVFSTAVTVLTILILLTAAMLFVPRIFCITPFVVLSGSMEPAIPTGSVVFIDTKDIDVSVGDVVTYKLPSIKGGDTLVTHRIVGEDDGNWITKGDANDVEDLSPVSSQQIVGSYRFLIPVAGYLITQLNKKVVTVVVVWVLLLNGMSLILSFVFDEQTKEKAAGEEDQQ